MKFATSLFATVALLASTVLAGPADKHTPKPAPLTLSRRILDGTRVPFIPHNGTALFTNWVGQNLDFNLVVPFLEQVRANPKWSNGTLINRGDAHITVILPTEYDQILAPAGVTIDEINALALKHNQVQKAKFHIQCLGRVQNVVNGIFEQAVQIIVKSDDIVAFRQKVFELFVSKGGNPATFGPDNFTPHITIGFRNRDMFAPGDGIWKSTNACIEKIVFIK